MTTIIIFLPITAVDQAVVASADPKDSCAVLSMPNKLDAAWVSEVEPITGYPATRALALAHTNH